MLSGRRRNGSDSEAPAVRSRTAQASVDRHRVILPARHAPDIAEFSPRATVYVEGQLASHGERQRVSVVAHWAWSIAPAPPAPEEGRPTGTHASPPEHQRAGHARRVAIGTASERLIWVRPTTVYPGHTSMRE